MKRINLKDYHKNMGILIDIQNPVDYQKYHHPDSINIPYEKLLLYHKTLLSKDKAYYIVCNKGLKSRKAVSLLEYYGYNVTSTNYE